jgi:hypothetical protein
MSEALEARAEILKLARLLGRESGELEYLQEVPARDIRRLREQVVEMLFAEQSHILNRLAAASRLLPIGVVATIGERVFGPVLSARIAGMLDPGRAVEMAAKLPTAFLADVAIEIDPRRASAVIGRIPARRTAEIAQELLRRHEYVTMGRFVGHLPDEAVAAALDVTDDTALLQVAFVLEEKPALDRFVRLLGLRRLDGVIDAAAHGNLWPEALDLLEHLSTKRRSEFADRMVARDDEVIDSLIATAQREDLWDELEPMSHSMSEASKRRFAERLRAAGLQQRVAPLGLDE